jgi:hypothetical protein
MSTLRRLVLTGFCKFYKNSICTLKEGYCDLNCNETNCNETLDDKDIQYYDKLNRPTQRRMGEVQKKVESEGWKLGSLGSCNNLHFWLYTQVFT